MSESKTATERLRELLDERGVEWRAGLDGVTFVSDWCFVEYGNGKLAATCEPVLTSEQAIAATLGSEPPYDALIRCLENDWHIRASWDGLRKFWSIELTDEGMRMRDAAHGTLTAEQVREAVMSADRWEKPMGNTGLTNTHLIIRDDGWQAITDELNATLGSGECENVSGVPLKFTCSKCEDSWSIPYDGFNYCPNCGAKVVGR